MADIRGTAVLDDFQRPAEDPISWDGRWLVTDPTVWTGMSHAAFGDATHGAAGSPSDSYWTLDPTLSGDVELWGICSGGGATGIAWGLDLWSNVGSNVDGYRFRIEYTIVAGPVYLLYRFDNGLLTPLAQVAAPAGAANGAEAMLIRRNGNDVECWVAHDRTDLTTWSLVLSATDTTYMGGFRLGMGITDNSQFQILGWTSIGGGVPNRTQIIRWLTN